MSIKETVKQALTAMPGNKPFAACDLVLTNTTTNASALLDYTPEQIKRALRDIPYVRKVNGRYIVKGRKVPAQNAPKPIVTVKCNSCHKFATHNSRIDQESGICGRCAQTVDRKAAQRATHPRPTLNMFGTPQLSKTHFGSDVLEYIEGPLVDITTP